MTFITLNRPDVFKYDDNNNVTSKHQQPYGLVSNEAGDEIRKILEELPND